MAGRARDIAIRYVVDTADKGTKELLRDDRRIRREVQQTARALERQGREATQAGNQMARAAGRGAQAQDRLERQAEQTSRALSRQDRASHGLGRTHRTATVAAERQTRAQDRLEKSSRRVGVAGRLAGGGLTVFGRGATLAAGAVGVVGLGGAIRFMAQEVGEAQKVTAQTDAAIRSTGAAANVTEKHVARLASSMARKTGIDDEMIQSGANVLLTFTRIRNEAGRGNRVFDRANQAALDLSVRFGKDLNSSAIMVGKALNDPIRGLTALGRAGVQFDDQQKDQIKTLIASGRRLDAQKVILRELERQVGGSARAYGRTLPGALGRAQVALGDLAEKYGNKLAPSVDRAVNRTTRFVRQIETGRGAGGRFRRTVEQIADGFGDVIRPIARVTGEVARFAGKHPAILKVAGGIAAVGLAIRALRFARAVSGIDQVLGGLRRLARTRAGEAVANNVVSNVRGIPGRTRRILDGMRGLMRRIMGRAGTTGGSAMATGFVDTSTGRIAGSTKNGRLSKLASKTGPFAKLGKSIGAAMGLAIALEAADALEKNRGNLPKRTGTNILGFSNDPLGIKKKLDSLFGGREGGRIPRYATGGLVPAYLSSGEMAVEPSGRMWTVPGRRTAADNVLATVPSRTEIFTDHGQSLLAAGASRREALASQLPHFRAGGKVAQGAYTSTSYGPPWGGINGRGITRTGVDLRRAPQRHLIAVDPRMIALHSKVRVWPNPFDYRGAFAAEDTGGAIKGNRIDFYDWRGRREQMDWGRKNVRVTRAGSGDSSPQEVRALRGRTRLGFGGGLPSGTRAFASGFQAGLEGVPLWDADILPDIAAAARARITRPEPAGVLARARARRGSGPAGRGGDARVSAAISEMHRIDRMRIPYVYGGGHTNPAPSGGPFDCSSAVARVMQAARFNWPTGVSGDYMRRGERGRGRLVTILSNPGHTYMAVRRQARGGWSAWGTSRSNPAGSPGWVSGGGYPFRGGFTATHPRGYQRGGVVGRSLTRLVGLPTESPRVKSTLRNFAGLIDTVDEVAAMIVRDQLAQVRERFRRLGRGGITRRERPRARALLRESRDLREQLAAAPSYGRLERVERNIAGRIRRMQRGGVTRAETVGIRRLQSAQRLVQTEMGRRVGLITRGIEKQAETIERNRNALSRNLRIRGIDEASSAGVAALARYSQEVYGQLEQSRLKIEQQLRRAVRRRDRTAISDLQERLRGIRDELGETMATWIEQARAQVSAAAQERVDVAQHGASIAQLRLDRFELQQKLAGTYETGGQTRADFIRNTRLPAISAEFAALQVQLAAAQQAGNAELARQIVEGLEGKLNEQLQVELDIKEAAEQTAENTDSLKEFTGTTAFEAFGERFTDRLLGATAGI